MNFSNKLGNREALGFLLFFGPLQFIITVLIAEGITDSYNSSLYYVSSLGVGTTAFLFNTTVLILGLCVLLGTYFFYKEYAVRVPTLFLLLTAICAIGVGIFPEMGIAGAAVATIIAGFASILLYIILIFPFYKLSFF